MVTVLCFYARHNASLQSGVQMKEQKENIKFREYHSYILLELMPVSVV